MLSSYNNTKRLATSEWILIRINYIHNLHTKIFLLKHRKFEKILTLEGQDFFTTFDNYYFASKQLKTREFLKIQTFFGLKRQKFDRICRKFVGSVNTLFRGKI